MVYHSEYQTNKMYYKINTNTTAPIHIVFIQEFEPPQGSILALANLLNAG